MAPRLPYNFRSDARLTALRAGRTTSRLRLSTIYRDFTQVFPRTRAMLGRELYNLVNKVGALHSHIRSPHVPVFSKSSTHTMKVEYRDSTHKSTVIPPRFFACLSMSRPCTPRHAPYHPQALAPNSDRSTVIPHIKVPCSHPGDYRDLAHRDTVIPPMNCARDTVIRPRLRITNSQIRLLKSKRKVDLINDYKKIITIDDVHFSSPQGDKSRQ